MLAGDHFVWPTLFGDSALLPYVLPLSEFSEVLLPSALRFVSGAGHRGGLADRVARVTQVAGFQHCLTLKKRQTEAACTGR